MKRVTLWLVGTSLVLVEAGGTYAFFRTQSGVGGNSASTGAPPVRPLPVTAGIVVTKDHIGPIKSNINDLVDRAPDGALAFDLGAHRYAFNGNWKLQVENVLDSYHVSFSHVST
jgi:hypothetical protein